MNTIPIKPGEQVVYHVRADARGALEYINQMSNGAMVREETDKAITYRVPIRSIDPTGDQIYQTAWKGHDTYGWDVNREGYTGTLYLLITLEKSNTRLLTAMPVIQIDPEEAPAPLDESHQLKPRSVAVSLDTALSAVTTHEAEEIPDIDLRGWYAVSTAKDGGVIAYFASEEAALAYRLLLVSQLCNPNGFKPGQLG